MTVRLSTSNAYDSTIANLSSRQSTLATLQNQLSAGKRIVSASDDPAGAARAERASTRIARLQADQNALASARDSMSTAESTLGDSVSLLQSARDAILSAGNGSYSVSDRASLVQQLQGIRDQLIGQANTKDGNGQYVFAGQGSVGAPFVAGAASVSFTGNPGQASASAASVPHSLDGNALFMTVPTGNGVFDITPAGTNTGSGYTDGGQVITPSALTGNNYAISFSQVGANTFYSVTNTTTGGAVATNQAFTAGQAIQFDGMAVTVKGSPGAGDQYAIQPSSQTSAFSVLDQAIAGLSNAGSNAGQVMQTVQQSLLGLDMSMERLQVGRSQAGDWMNRADASAASMTSQGTQLNTTLSQAQDMDMVKGLSDFQSQQTAYDAALKTYAQVQHLSLFQYING